MSCDFNLPIIVQLPAVHIQVAILRQDLVPSAGPQALHELQKRSSSHARADAN
jgi:hypothetical protein